MSVTIHCIRHGQGLHNVGGNYQLPDPKLTELGIQQCTEVKDLHFAEQSHISLVAASALSRTLHSASIIFEPWLSVDPNSRQVLALPDAQETSNDPCDIGSDPDILRATCQKNDWPVDLSLVKDGWNDKSIQSRYSGASTAIARRARDARVFLRQKATELLQSGVEDVHIALVTHGGFLHYFTEDWEGADNRLTPGTGWTNCETRSYKFVAGIDTDGVGEDDDDAHLIETAGSRCTRELVHPMFTGQRQMELYEMAMQSWEDQNLPNPAKILVV